MTKLLQLTLAVRIFEQLAAEAKAANIPSVELVRRFIAARYELDAVVSDSAEKRSTLDLRSNADLIREGEAIFLQATDAYGQIDKNLGKVFATAERCAIIEENLLIVGDAIALLRELLDLVQSLSLPPACRARRGSPRGRMPNAANDDVLSA